jgi:hypothetical protein
MRRSVGRSVGVCGRVRRVWACVGVCARASKPARPRPPRVDLSDVALACCCRGTADAAAVDALPALLLPQPAAPLPPPASNEHEQPACTAQR